jgi:hypothetical protein
MQATGENKRIASIAQSDVGPIARILAGAIAAEQRIRANTRLVERSRR